MLLRNPDEDVGQFMGFTDRLLYEWLEYKRIQKFPLRSSLYILASTFILSSLATSAISHWFSPLSMLTEAKKSPSAPFDWKEKVTFTEAKTKVVLDRNLFNRTGEVPEEERAEKAYTGIEAIKSTLPFTCVGIIFGGDPHSGIAVIEDTAKHVANSFFVGDALGTDATVSEVLQDRVVVERGGHREYFQLERNLDLDKKRKKKGIDSSGGSQGFATEPPPDKYKEDGFERQGTAITVSTDFRTKLITNDLSKVLQDAKAEPNLVGNELAGFRLTRIRKDSIFEKLGLQNDDVVREVNGVSLSDAAQSVKLLNSLRGESDVEFRVERGGKQMTFNLQTK